MLVVYVQERKIRYFDSSKTPDAVFCDLMHMYLEEEWKALGNKNSIDDHDDGPWNLVKKSPKGDARQKNGRGCGILMCAKVEHLFAKQSLPRGEEQCFQHRMEYALQIVNHCGKAKEKRKKGTLPPMKLRSKAKKGTRK